MRPLLVTAAVGLAAAVAASTAFASSLGGMTSRDAGAGSAAVAACDTAFSVSYTGQPGPVSAVVVSGVDPACTGGAMSLTVADSSGAAVAAGGPVTVAGTSVTVPISPQPSSEAARGVHVVVVGP